MNKKNILFLHQNFPGQFKHLAPEMAKSKRYNVYSLSLDSSNTHSLDDLNNSLKDIKHYKYKIIKGNSEGTIRLAIEFETKMIRASAVLERALKLKEEGLEPDLLIIHPGWGEGFVLKEVWPNAKFLNYFEFYYNTKDSDVDFDLKEENRPDYDIDLRTKLVARNSTFLSACNQSDIMISPTKFQKSTAPKEYQNKIKVVHDGIDTKTLISNPEASVTLSSEEKKIILTKSDKTILFINRNLEPYRGYHIFMRSLPEVIKKHPDAYILIVGGSEVSYGARPKGDSSFKDIYFNEIKKDIPKDHKIKFLGTVKYNLLLSLLDIASVHVYLTYPFVLSWSMLESMSLGGLILGSKTAPVEEVIKHNKNGLLVDFFDHDAISKNINKILDDPKKFISIRKEARKTIENNYDLYSKCLPEQLNIVESLFDE
tara:strand:+ start:4420 stop:5700 length:1281 start_codon:yes stop_codon:yes gene_type:complete